jgi:tRNA1Val (adenine37-N6)-methyltransferase
MKQPNEKFRFRQFEVSHHRSTMKVGTDAVVLGAWLEVAGARRILEIGTGCGIIALMLAQKTLATIDAIDVDEASANEASENFASSPWNDRLHSFHISLNDFAPDKTGTYDLIVSNPPFFQNSMLPPTKGRQLARHNVELTFDTFLSSSSRLLSREGKLAVILPCSEEVKFIEIAGKEGLFLQSKLDIFPKPSKPKKRVILVFSSTKRENTIADSIILRNEDGHYSDDYKRITKDFHAGF